MKKIYYILLSCFLFNGLVFNASAQIGKPFEQEVISLSPSDRMSNNFRFNTQHHIKKAINKQAALLELQNDNWMANHMLDDSIIPLKKVNIGTRYYNGEIEGDYLPDEGNAFSNTEIMARGINGTLKHGTIFGEASFSKGMHKNYGWNAIRHANLYRPYLIADSTGGDYKYENYYLSGAYGFKLKNVYLGLGGQFRGEVAYRQTDPRCANTTTWLILDASSAIRLSNSQFISVRGSYIKNKQHLDLWNWKSQQQDKFFLTYGFGYYDLRESPIFFGIKRMYYIQGQSYQLTYGNTLSKSPKNTTFLFNLDYRNLVMKTEESGNGKNLFGATMHRINALLKVGLFQKRALKWDIILQSHNNLRFGRESIYENYVPDEDYPSIYDFRLVNIRERYTDKYALHSIQSKLSYQTDKHLTLELLLGVYMDDYAVNYKKPVQKCYASSIYPTAGIGIKQNQKDLIWEFNSRVVIKKLQIYDYDVKSGKHRIDYQTTFLPYAFQTDESFSIHNELFASYPVNKKKNRIGINVHYYLRKGQRPDDVRFNGTPMPSEILSTPKIGTVHNIENWINITLSYSI